MFCSCLCQGISYSEHLQVTFVTKRCSQEFSRGEFTQTGLYTACFPASLQLQDRLPSDSVRKQGELCSACGGVAGGGSGVSGTKVGGEEEMVTPWGWPPLSFLVLGLETAGVWLCSSGVWLCSSGVWSVAVLLWSLPRDLRSHTGVFGCGLCLY